MTTQLFGTDGIRGPAGLGKLSPPALTRLGLAVARVLVDHAGSDGPRALLARDTRISGPAVAAAVSAGLLAGGVEVHDGGVLPTPAVALLVRRRGFDVGVVVSASHNPWRDNGIKLLGSAGSKLEDVEEEAVEAAYGDDALERAVDPEAIAGLRTWPDAPQVYEDALVREFRGVRLRRLHVVVDAANGAQSGIAKRVLRRLGARVTAINDRPDGKNINERCGALHPAGLRRAVKSHGAAVGVAFDGDADRLQLVDEAGRLLDGDVVLAALAPRLRARRRLPHATVVGTVMTNAGLEADFAKNGIQLVRTAVGDRNIVSEMAGRGYGLGGEPSGHLILPRRGLLTGDALYAAVACLRILAEERLAASELRGTYRPWPLEIVSLPVRRRVPLRDLPRTWGAIEEGQERLGREGRLVVRYSGTEPKVRVMVEARRTALVRKVLGPLVAALEEEVGVG